MSTFLVILVSAVILVGCGTYRGGEMWRRSTCEPIVDIDERAKCLEEATRSESEYEQEVEEAVGE